MNAKQLFAAAALAMIGASVMASEITFPAEAGQLTRAEVQAELARARNAGELSRASDVYGNFPAVTYAAAKSTPSATTTVGRSRDEVREEGRQAARSRKFNELFVGG